MKKSIVALCLAALPLATFAQEEGAKYGPYERTSFWSNTYVGIEAASDQVISHHTAKNETKDWLLSGGGNLAVGKWLTPFYGVEFKGGFSNAYICDHRSKIWNWQLDAPINLTNWIWGYKEDRKWSWQASLGAGLKRTDDLHNTTTKHNLFLEVGTKAVWSINKQWDLNLGLALDAQERTVYLDNNSLRGASKLSLGLTYNIKRGFKAVENCSAAKYHTSCDARISDLEQQLAASNSAKDAALAALEAAKNNQPEAQSQTTAPETSILFRINSDKIMDNYKYNLKAYADAINSGDSQYTVYGYADLQTGTRAYNEKLALKRAEAVKNLLVNEYGCKSEQIECAVGDLDNAPFENSTYNRAVIVKTK